MTSVSIPRPLLPARKVNLPASWAEASRMQAIYFIRLLFMYGTGDSTIGTYTLDFQFRYLQACLGLIDTKFYRLTDLQVTMLISRMKQLFTTTCTVPAVRSFVHQLRRYHYPQRNFKDLSFIEFCYAEIFYRRILSNNEPDRHLALLTAVLCRQHVDGKRPPHDDEAMERNAKAFEKLDAEFKYFAFFYLHGIIMQLRSTYPHVFKSVEDTDTNVEELLEGDGFIPAIHIISESGVFGTWEQTAHSNMHLVLNYMNNHHERMKESKPQKPN